jgi:hypothetical protein
VRIVSTLVPYLIGAATALAVQMLIEFFVVPRVETRKRREDRFERNVLELGVLLTSLVDERAQVARLEQSVFRAMRQREYGPEFDQAKVARGLAERASTTRQVTSAFTEAIYSRVGWIAERVTAFMPDAEEIKAFQIATMRHGLAVLAIGGWSEDDDRTDDAFEEGWRNERNARDELIQQVKLLANMPHPPRLPRFDLLRHWRRTGRFGKKSQSVSDR